jgi:hypothetical protein
MISHADRPPWIYQVFFGMLLLILIDRLRWALALGRSGGHTKPQIGCGYLIAYIWDKQHLKV